MYNSVYPLCDIIASNEVMFDCSIKSDFRNVIFKNIKTECDNCKQPTTFLNFTRVQSSDNLFSLSESTMKLCPSCFYEKSLGKRYCSTCDRRWGCDSCGGIKSEKMINLNSLNGPLLLCYQNLCLNPFGYRTEEIPKCNCRVVCWNEINKVVNPNLSSMIKKNLPNDLTIGNSWETINIPINVKQNKENICSGCQYLKKYTLARGKYENPCSCK
jgi:hypothetical protein